MTETTPSILLTVRCSDFGSPLMLTAIVDGKWPSPGRDACWIVSQEGRTRAMVGFPEGADADAVKAAVTPYWLGSRIRGGSRVEWTLSRSR